MKKIVSSLFIVAFLFATFQCSVDDSKQAITPQTQKIYTIGDLVFNTKFETFSYEAQKLKEILDRGFYSVKTFEKAKKRNDRISEILKGEVDEKETAELVKYFGFNDMNNYNEVVKSFETSKQELLKEFPNIKNEVNKAVLLQAVRDTQRTGEILKVESGPQFCVECPMNNCDVCGASSDGGNSDPRIDPGTGVGGGVSCQTLCLNKRNGDIGLAWDTFVAASVIGCGALAIQYGGAGAVLGPLGPLAFGGTIFLLCTVGFLQIYYDSKYLAEVSYQQCLASCPH